MATEKSWTSCDCCLARIDVRQVGEPGWSVYLCALCRDGNCPDCSAS